MTTRPECEQLPIGLQDICDGRAYDARKTDIWRARRGLPPLNAPAIATDHSTVRPKPVKPNVIGGPGTELAKLFKAWGIKDSEPLDIEDADAETARAMGDVTLCTGCQGVAKTMDESGPDWCEEHIDTIVESIKRHAANRKVPIFGTMDRLPLFDITARKFVSTAIRRARDARP